MGWIWCYRAKFDQAGNAYCDDCGHRVDVARDVYCPACAAPVREKVPVTDNDPDGLPPLPGELEDHLGLPADDEGRPRPRPGDVLHRPTSSAGRDVPDPADWEARHRFVERLEREPLPTFDRHLDGAGGGYWADLADAEALKAQTAADLADAEADMRERTRLINQEHVLQRAATADPEVNWLMHAPSRYATAKAADEAAQARLDRLLAQMPESVGDFERRASRYRADDDWSGLSPIDRDRGW